MIVRVFGPSSGIGGMYTALSKLNLNIKKVIPFDINTNANKTYNHNYNINPIEKSIESITVQKYEKMIEEIDNKCRIIWSMSPPCQPYTRQGNQKGLEDNRSNSFKHLMNILSNTKYKPYYLILENVKGFETSEASIILKDILNSNKYDYLQFLICSSDFNIPNKRPRFYCIAKKDQFTNIDNSIKNIIITKEYVPILFKEDIMNIKTISEFLNITINDNIPNNLLVKKETLEKETSYSFDIVNLNSIVTECFTKNYNRFMKGTGSILLLDNIKTEDINIKQYVNKIRYFSPIEIAKLLYFDSNFSFPDDITISSQYKLVGNSLNVKVVEILLKYMLKH